MDGHWVGAFLGTENMLKVQTPVELLKKAINLAPNVLKSVPIAIAPPNNLSVGRSLDSNVGLGNLIMRNWLQYPPFRNKNKNKLMNE